MSEATSGSISHTVPHVAKARRKTRVNALMAHAGYMLAAWASMRSPDEQSDIRVYLARSPACRYAHAGYMG
jgi:hypothetical protein